MFKYGKKENIRTQTNLNFNCNHFAPPFLSSRAKTILPPFNNLQNFNCFFPKDINQIFNVDSSMRNHNNSFYKSHNNNIFSQISQRIDEIDNHHKN